MQQLPKELLITQIENGFILMVLGMGVVFLFLLLLVLSTKLLSSIIGKFSPLPQAPVSNGTHRPVAT